MDETVAIPSLVPMRFRLAARRLSCTAGQGARPVWLAALVISSFSAQAEGVWRNVRGADLRALFPDHELADGVHYAYQFRGDGTFNGFSMGKAISGTWRTDGNEFCWTQKRRGAVEECFEVERSGPSVRLMRDGVEAVSAKLPPLAKLQPPTDTPR